MRVFRMSVCYSIVKHLHAVIVSCHQCLLIPRLIKDFLLLLSAQLWFFKEKQSLVMKLREDSDLFSVRRVCLHFILPLSHHHLSPPHRSEQHAQHWSAVEVLILCKLAPPCGQMLPHPIDPLTNPDFI